MVDAAIAAEKKKLEVEKRPRTGRTDSARAHFREAGADRSGANDNAQRAELQSRHLEEQIKLERAQDRRLWEHEEQLADYYSATPYREELAELEDRRRLRRSDRERMEDLRLSIADADRRAQEYREGFSQQQARERAELQDRQERERRALERRLAGQEPKRSAEPERTQSREHQPHGPPQGRGRERTR